MNLTESSAPDFNIDSFFNYFEEESKGIIQLEREKVFIAQTVDSTNTRLKALLDEAGPIYFFRKIFVHADFLPA